MDEFGEFLYNILNPAWDFMGQCVTLTSSPTFAQLGFVYNCILYTFLLPLIASDSYIHCALCIGRSLLPILLLHSRLLQHPGLLLHSTLLLHVELLLLPCFSCCLLCPASSSCSCWICRPISASRTNGKKCGQFKRAAAGRIYHENPIKSGNGQCGEVGEKRCTLGKSNLESLKWHQSKND